ncbi:MAG: beta-L-arabinofuranosidase domain-containing protein [Thermoguttaceae bacterium]|jgi:DUF1680 family protein
MQQRLFSLKSIGLPRRYALAAIVLAAAMGCAGGLSAAPRNAEEFAPLDLRQVKVAGEIGRRIDNTIFRNLMVIDVNKEYLAYLNAKTSSDRYVGLGKLIDAAVKLAAYSGDEKVLARKKYIVDKTLATQERDGYLGFIAAPNRMRTPWDIHEMGYIIYGLTSDHHYFQEERSLKAAEKIADYLLAHWKDLPANWPRDWGVAANLACTGLERAMLALARESHDMRYRDFCTEQRALPQWNLDPITGRRPLIEGHTYSYLARCLAQLDLDCLQEGKNPALLSQSRKAWDFMIRGEGMTITGGCGQWECWTDDQDGRGALGETCSTAYQLRFLDQLQRRCPNSSHFSDLMERTIYNALFAAQSPDGRRIRYYTPFEGPREYFGPDNFCCPGNFRRIMAELPSMVYYRAPNAVMVNLYTPSTAKDISLTPKDKTLLLTLRQETDYPNSGRVTLLVDPSKECTFSLQLRIPGWCPRATVSVNGIAEQGPFKPGDYATLTRQWKAGDRVELNLEMPWRFVLGRQRQAGRVAVMRGPLLFCVNPQRKENARYKDVDGVDLGRFVLVPESIQSPLPDDGVRPHGQACRIKAFTPGYGCDQPDTELFLTEFPDPNGRAVYFRLRDLSQGVKDELLGPAAPRDEW